MNTIKKLLPWIALWTAAMVEVYALDRIMNALPEAISLTISVIYLVILIGFVVYMNWKTRKK